MKIEGCYFYKNYLKNTPKEKKIKKILKKLTEVEAK
jgi:hypothetical protein